MKTITKNFLTIFLFASSFIFGQNLELYLGESLANVKKLMDQEKIDYREGLDKLKLPYLIYKEESDNVYMAISVHFDKKNGNDFVSKKVLISMPYNSYLDQEAFKGFASILEQKGYEKLSDTTKLNYTNVFKSLKNDSHKKEHYVYMYLHNFNKTGDFSKNDFSYVVGFVEDLALISK